jgi:hypothetical protein
VEITPAGAVDAVFLQHDGDRLRPAIGHILSIEGATLGASGKWFLGDFDECFQRIFLQKKNKTSNCSEFAFCNLLKFLRENVCLIFKIYFNIIYSLNIKNDRKISNDRC